MRFSTAVRACSGWHCVVKRVAAERCAPTTLRSFLLQPVAPFVPILGHGNAEKGPRLAQTRYTIKKEQLNSLILTPLLPSLSPFPHEHTSLVQMYPNRRGIQKGMWFKKERKKVSTIFLSCKSFFFSFFSYIVFFL